MPRGGGGGGGGGTVGGGGSTSQTGGKTTSYMDDPDYALNTTVEDKFKDIINTPGDYGSSSLNAEGATSAFNSSLNAEGATSAFNSSLNEEYSKFAKGGVVNGATLAMVGEGGEREYIIPESKMAAASANYMNGARGGAVIPAFANGGVVGPSRMAQGRNSTAIIKPQISIQTGPVMQMDGTNYVTMQDLGRAVQTGVRQTLNIIKGDINMRSQMGLS
jgi:hypothetical protein